ncbi:MAG TPA: ribonuclease R [Chitinophagales bacterium]|nr:ribonuclease R [Chitinophagales bacterium]
MPNKKSKNSNGKDLRSSILSYLKDLDQKKSITEGQISRKLSAHFTKNEVIKALYALTAEGMLSMNAGNKFKLKKSVASAKSRKVFVDGEGIIGTVDMTKNGSAYVIPEDGSKDIYVQARDINKAFNKDQVKVQITNNSRSRPEGIIVEIVERSRTIFIGIVDKKKHCFVRLDNQNMNVDFFIPEGKSADAQDGDKVVVEMVDWPTGAKNPFGKINEVLGKAGHNDVEMKSLLIENGFFLKFSKETMNEAHALKVEVSAEEIEKRRDFRKVPTFTIDPLDAKDFDDAISIQTLGENKWEIGIHIADVSHYVKEGSAMDIDALKRATSVYLVDRVAPMFPEELSNIVCSLRPNEEKLCFSAVFEMDEHANVTNRWFGRTVIYSDKRFVYEEAQEIIDGKASPYAKDLKTLNHLAQQLRKKRFKEGSVNFDSPEVRFQLDDQGKPIGLYVKERVDTHLLVEDFMLLANRHVAQYVGKEMNAAGKNVFVYRVHDEPDSEKLRDFALFASRFGHKLNFDSPKQIAHEINKLMLEIEGSAEQHLLQQLAIRCMAKATYTTENIGHYGLGFEYYAHFTSPIRRYPDVMVHRLLELVLQKKPLPNPAEIEAKSKHCSERERAAMDAERSSVKYKMIEFMQDRIGEVFRGVVSGVKSWGVYVELPQYNTEGLIRLESFTDDKYVVDEKNMMIKGLFSDKKYFLGDEIFVKLTFVDKVKKTIDFELSSESKWEEKEEEE